MRQREYHSELTPEEIRARLLLRARPMHFGCMYEEHQVFVKLLPEGRFYLLKTGGVWQIRPQVPFAGAVTRQEKGSLITGEFALTRGTRVQIAVMAVLVFFTGAAVTHEMLISLIVALLAWGMWRWLLWEMVAAYSWQSNQETLEWMERQLLCDEQR